MIHWIAVSVLLVLGMVVSVIKRKLTLRAALTGGCVGMLVFAGGGYTGLVMLVVFFVLGTLATSWKKEKKLVVVEGVLPAERRNTGQVLANGGVAALCGLLALLDAKHAAMYQFMMAGSLASATADTLSSELGMVYGRRFYNIITWQPDIKGLDGVVSREGTVIGIAGALFMGLLFVLPGGAAERAWFVALAGVAGNLADSVVGAVWERKHIIGNNLVNFINTLFAALVAWTLWFLWMALQ
ncbi:TIGR00297 family protein [Filimonas lacunae]|uniref:TIGR00297 family protein n=1 Tax=Filimonas lacunae TaxID=477680 RepID=A0A173MK05_9BACT|nr:DUF92 domain-containing protein [Filimonas lacunae]BAV07830.1 hypothetical protein FLA_3861 [Filimonas lacunae]SIT05334.1 TIGR00297 family protein [Filimonas lacunae]